MGAEDVARPMKFPYTYTAKIVQFPYKYYFQHSWGVKYAVFAFFPTAYIFWKIEKLSKSPENVKKWDEIHRKEFYGEGHH